MKIGIITHYYNSTNYGGILQSYALCRYINENSEFYAEQIVFSPSHSVLESEKLNLSVIIVKVLLGIKKRIAKALFMRINNKIQRTQKAAFSSFSNSIPHSDIIYTDDNISHSNEKYDVFITGSDQVWNPKWYNPAYFLAFVTTGKPKFSYAASIGKVKLSTDQKKLFERSLSDYIGVSVREEEAVTLLNNLRAVEWVLDPTLLLSRNEWDEVCSDRIIQDKYVFCFFLGNDRKMRKAAVKFAKQRNLRVVTIPYLLGKFRVCDVSYGDIKLSGVAPEQFISLIKHAEFIFTDSFHACVFSSIYEKQYFAFTRAGAKEMGSRIYNLIKLYDNEDHFCDTPDKVSVKYINNLPKLDYSKQFCLLEVMRRNSITFLNANLRKSLKLVKCKYQADVT